jgi:hypothetical protein
VGLTTLYIVYALRHVAALVREWEGMERIDILTTTTTTSLSLVAVVFLSVCDGCMYSVMGDDEGERKQLYIERKKQQRKSSLLYIFCSARSLTAFLEFKLLKSKMIFLETTQKKVKSENDKTTPCIFLIHERPAIKKKRRREAINQSKNPIVLMCASE